MFWINEKDRKSGQDINDDVDGSVCRGAFSLRQQK